MWMLSRPALPRAWAWVNGSFGHSSEPVAFVVSRGHCELYSARGGRLAVAAHESQDLKVA